MTFYAANLKIKKDGRGRLIFYETTVAKIIQTLLILVLLYIIWFVLEKKEVEDIINSWPFQIAGLLAFVGIVYIWHRGYVEFDEMTKRITLNRGLRKLIWPRKVPYSEADGIVLRKHVTTSDEGGVFVQGYFHLRLKNGQYHLLFVFEGSEHIFAAQKKLKNHLSLKFIS